MVVALCTPLLGRGGMMARLSLSSQSCGRNASSSWSSDREQDHVIAKTGGHELEAPEPNHRGAWNRRNESGHLERNGEIGERTRRTPTWRANCRCFPPGGSHQRVNLYAYSLSQMVMQEDTKIYPGSGKRRPYVQWGREVCIISHRSACIGANTSVV